MLPLTCRLSFRGKVLGLLINEIGKSLGAFRLVTSLNSDQIYRPLQCEILKGNNGDIFMLELKECQARSNTDAVIGSNDAL